MAYVGTSIRFGSEYKVPLKYMVPFMAIVVPALVVILGYMTYLVLESVDYYLGTKKPLQRRGGKGERSRKFSPASCSSAGQR